MTDDMSIELFLNACKLKLGRAEAVIDSPIQLTDQLILFEEFLRTHWPTIIENCSTEPISSKNTEELQKVFEQIKKLELISNSRSKMFDGMADFMER